MDELLRKWGRYLLPLLLIFTISSALSLFFREMWFDEVLTLDLVNSASGFSNIYQSYFIPNNHIVYSFFLYSFTQFLEMFTPSLLYFCFRLPSLIMATASIYLLWRILKRYCGVLTAFPVLLLLGSSATYCLSGTAVRGYMLGFFLILCAFLCAEKWIYKNSFLGLCAYFIFAFFAIGTTPTNLAPLIALAIFFSARLFDSHKMFFKLLALYLSPFLVLILFYLPIRDQFLHCMDLGEGWSSISGAIANLYFAYLYIFLPLLPFVFYGIFLLWTRNEPNDRKKIVCAVLIFLLPIPAFFLFKAPPFPRVFFPLFAIWTIFLAYTVKATIDQYRKKIFFGIFILCSIWVLLGSFRVQSVSDFMFGDPLQDDLMAPRYARSNFKPSATAAVLQDYLKDHERCAVFLTFESDPPSISYALSLYPKFSEIFGNRIIMDRPNQPKIIRLTAWPEHLLVASGEADAEAHRERFGFSAFELLADCGVQKIYKVIK